MRTKNLLRFFSALFVAIAALNGTSCRKDELPLLEPLNSQSAQAALQDWQSMFQAFLIADSAAKNPTQFNASCWQLSHDTVASRVTTTIRLQQQTNCGCYDSAYTGGVIRVIYPITYPSLFDTVRIELDSFRTGISVYDGEMTYVLQNSFLQQFAIRSNHLNVRSGAYHYELSGTFSLKRLMSPGVFSGNVSGSGDLTYETNLVSLLLPASTALRSNNHFVSGETDMVIAGEKYRANYGDGVDDNLVTVITKDNFRYILQLASY